MDSTGASSTFDSFKSKKIHRCSVNKLHSSDEALEAPAQSPWSSKTPEKPTQPPRRPITRRQSLRSVSQVREAAKQLRQSDHKPPVSSDPVTSSGASTETLTSKSNSSKLLPDKYEILYKFFNSLQSAIRLLRLKGKKSTFTNISRQVEILTDRRFSHSHLAQIKFILPEAIELKKILVRDERTSCMIPDLQVTFNFDIVENDDKQDPGTTNLRMIKLFRARLLSFCKSNPEGDEVPEDILPELFNKLTQVTFSTAIETPNLSLIQNTTQTSQQQPTITASHMPQSFKRRFSKQVPNHNAETSDQESKVLTKLTCVSTPIKLSAYLPETPIKNFDSDKKEDFSSVISTPAQEIQPPKTSFMTPDDESMMSPPSKLTRRLSGRRSITFDTPVKNKNTVKTVSAADDDKDDDLCDILTGDLFAAIKEKEQKALDENNPSISQAKWRKQMIAGLPKLFNILWYYFHEIKRSVVTKDELMHKIYSSQLEIVDRREVDEQLRLLQNLAPEWIYEKMASNGDLMFCVSKISSPDLIRTRLSEAI